MKIAYVCHLYPPYLGGVEKYVHAIATRLKVHHDITVITTDPSKKLPKLEAIDGVFVRRFPSLAPSESIYYSTEMFRYLREHSDDYHLVHANNYHALPSYYAAESKRRNKLVFSPHFHGAKGHSMLRNLLHIPYRLLGGRIFRRSDLVICSTNFERNEVLRDFRVPSSRLRVVRQGVDYTPPAPADKTYGRKRLLCVSRLERYKGIQYVMRSLEHLPSFELVIVGTGPYGGRLHRLAGKLGLEGRVAFRQAVSQENLDHMFSNSDVAILLSEHESYSQFVAQALSSGIPCVVAKRGALVEWVDDKTCIGVSNPRDSVEVAQAVLHLSDRKVTRSLPTWDDCAAKVEALYQALLS